MSIFVHSKVTGEPSLSIYRLRSAVRKQAHVCPFLASQHATIHSGIAWESTACARVCARAPGGWSEGDITEMMTLSMAAKYGPISFCSSQIGVS
jgi:hypothetical protein